VDGGPEAGAAVVTDAEELQAIADQVCELKTRFVKSPNGMFLQAEDQARFIGIITEAKSILGASLGHANSFTLQMIYTVNSGSGGFFGGPSYSCVVDTEEIIRAAIRDIERIARRRPLEFATAATKAPYVDPIRVADIEGLSRRKDIAWDFAKLARLCGELNIAHEHDCHFAVAMLVRAITDHVPPLFGADSFNQVGASSTAGRSFKGAMEHLDKSLRRIADGLLHGQIRKSESLPTATQVDFHQPLDQLLGEVIRITRTPG
jgi:hypothetical protein